VDALYVFPLQLPVTVVMGCVLLGALARRGNVLLSAREITFPRAVSAILLVCLIWPVLVVSNTTVKTYRGERYILKAMEAVKVGKFDEALDHFESASYLVKEYGELYFLTGVAYASRGRMDMAMREFGLCKGTFNNPSIYINKAIIALETRIYGEVDENLNKMSVLVPNHPQTHYLFGLKAYLSDQYEKAVREFQLELRRNKNNIRAHLYLGKSLQYLGKYKEAADAFKEAIKINPRNMVAHESLGILYSPECIDLPKQAYTHYMLALEIAKKTQSTKAVYRIRREIDKLSLLISE